MARIVNCVLSLPITLARQICGLSLTLMGERRKGRCLLFSVTPFGSRDAIRVIRH
jgi:hypothetical protein